MNEEIRKELIRARQLKFEGKYNEALEIYEEHYKAHPEVLKYQQREDYAWTLYRVYVQNIKDEDKLFDSAELITQLVEQKDMNVKAPCVYTSTVYRILGHLEDEHDFYSMGYWLDKINPEFLDKKPYRRYGRIQKSRKEYFFKMASTAYLNSGNYEKCIETCKCALDSIDEFQHEGDTWYRWRMAKSLFELGQYEESLACCLKVIEVKHEWYMYRLIADIYLRTANNYAEAMKYFCPAVLSNVSAAEKVNLYYEIYQMFDRFNKQLALPHAKLCYALKLERGARVPEDILALDIDEESLDSRALEKEVRNLWIQYKFRNHEPHEGTVVKYVEDKGYGLIKTGDDSIFFHKNDLESDNVFIGQKVSFYTEKNFDKSKNKESLKAVYINGL